MSLQTKHFYEFAEFRLDISEKVLLHRDKAISLTPKVFDTLQILIENPGRLLTKDELMQRIWQDRFVEESNLTFNIRMLRKALGDDATKPQFIETVPRRGYRFIAEVREIVNENVRDNSMSLSVSQPPVKIPAPTHRFKKLLVPSVGVLIFVLIMIVFWLRANPNPEAATPLLNAPFNSEKLSTNGTVVHAVVSSDGKTVVYTNGITGRQSVWLRQLDSATNVEIFPPANNIYGGLALSPDGNILYFVRRQSGSQFPTAIYRVSIFGGVPTKIIDVPQGWISISPDGERISFVRCYFREDDFCSLWIADAADGKNERKLISRPRPFRIADNEFSPDGRSVAFAVGQSENQANEFSLVEVDLESGTERELTSEKFFNIKNLAWLPDKSGLLLTASRIPNKNFRIWQVSAATGEAKPLTKDSETYAGLSLDKGANLLVSTQVKTDFRLHLLQMENPAAKHVLADATSMDFAPNGKIVFSSAMSGNDEIWSINADGTGQKQLTNNTADETTPIVTPDNNSIFFTSNRTGEAHIWRMNWDGSNQSQVTREAGGYPLFGSPDGLWLYYHHGLNRTLWRIALNSGKEELVLNKSKPFFALSPDGSKVAFSEKKGEDRVLSVVSLGNGQIVKAFHLGERKAILMALAWLPDGKNLIYTLSNSEYENNTLWLQHLDNERPQQISALGDEMVSSVRFAPNGNIVAIVQGSWKHDAVLLRGLR